MKTIFFSGAEYISVTRGDIGAGSVDPGYPKPISDWGLGDFGQNGIDAALYSVTGVYLFSGAQYTRVAIGPSGAGAVGGIAPISNWGWGTFGANGIDAALYSGSKCYFFCGEQYIRVTRGNVGAGTVDAGYPQPLSNWGWGAFGAPTVLRNPIGGVPPITHRDAAPGIEPIVPTGPIGPAPIRKAGIDGALYSGAKCYFFAGDQYIRVTRGDTGAGTVDPGYPKSISGWGWGGFGLNGISDALYNTGAPIKAPVSAPNLSLGAVSSSVINVFWTDPDGDVDGFNVHYNGTRAGSGPDNHLVVAGLGATSASADNLISGYTYQITATAFNAAGDGPVSNMIAATTPAAPTTPTPPPGRTIAASTSGSGADTVMTVTGSGFTGGALVVFKVTQGPNQTQFHANAASNGTVTATNPTPCMSGFFMTVTAFEDANPINTEATPVSTNCS